MLILDAVFLALLCLLAAIGWILETASRGQDGTDTRPPMAPGPMLR